MVERLWIAKCRVLDIISTSFLVFATDLKLNRLHVSCEKFFIEFRSRSVSSSVLEFRQHIHMDAVLSTRTLLLAG